MSTATTSFRKTTLSHAQKTVLAMSRAQYLDAISATRPADKLYVGVCIFRMDAHSSRPSVLLLRRSGSPGGSASNGNENGAGNNAKTLSTASTNTNTNSITTSKSMWGIGLRDKQHKHLSNGNGNGGGSRRETGRDAERNGKVGGEETGGVAGIWELPGGKVREGDFCISAAVARRVAEQTGLRVVRVLGALQDVRRVSEVRILDWDEDGVGIFLNGEDDGSGANMSVLDGATLTNSSGGGSRSGSGSRASTVSRRSPIHNPHLVLRRECLQLNYAVLVQNHEDLVIRSREHDELVWASFSRAEALRMPEELRTVVHQGLAFAGEYLF
ncbi:uncharacterized protein F4822DRAFT_439413 [Hypoxylon trugodes]|uniref:uncharacterized protein n=1 Tax=Hypoxylon trugodes TaxID=326681 RepID=UPI00218EF686|nr:uncharacterized protein F4822DRAFT_439413 [Hypoxylon trugodes]KAI1393278.1 hypothetical protein F4822DRAFT_439413 [Hypoxylon trugodes]